MTTNLTPYQFEFTVNGVDRADYLAEWAPGDDSADEERGIIQIRGKAILIGSPADRVLLDPELTPTAWAFGYEVVHSHGGTVTTRGRLYILKAVYYRSENRLELEVGCKLTLNQRETPPDDKSGIRPGTMTTRTEIITRLLNAAHITDIDIDITEHSIDYPLPRTEGNYIEQAGLLAADAGYCLWQDNTGTIVALPIPKNTNPPPDGTPILDAVDDLVDYEPEIGREVPTKAITATGTHFKTRTPEDDFVTRISYANGYKVTTTRIDRARSIVTETSETWLPRSTVGTDQEIDLYFILWGKGEEIIKVEESVTVKYFEPPAYRSISEPFEPNQNDQQRIIKKTIDTKAPLAAVIIPWLAERPDQAMLMYGRGDQYNLVYLSRVTEEYTYYPTKSGDPGDTFRVRTLDVRLSGSFDPFAGEGIGGQFRKFTFGGTKITNNGGGSVTFSPFSTTQTSKWGYYDFLAKPRLLWDEIHVIYSDTTQVYRNLPRRDWVELETRVLRPAAVINPKLREQPEKFRTDGLLLVSLGSVTDAQAYALISDPNKDSGTRTETTNSGQLQAPRPETFPAEKELETEDLSETVNFKPIAGTYQQDDRAREVKTLGEDPKDQLRLAANIKGTMVLGRYYGANIQVPYADWKPFDRVDIVDGTVVKSYVLDAISHVSTPTEEAVSALCLFTSQRVGASRGTLWTTFSNYASIAGYGRATDLAVVPGYASVVGNGRGTDEIVTPEVDLLEQEFQECYLSGKDTICVSLGIRQWRSDTTPNNGDGTWTFRACDGTPTTISPTLGGTISGIGSPVVASVCPGSGGSGFDGTIVIPYPQEWLITLEDPETPGSTTLTVQVPYPQEWVISFVDVITVQVPYPQEWLITISEPTPLLTVQIPYPQEWAITVADVTLYKAEEILTIAGTPNTIPTLARTPASGTTVWLWVRNAAYHNRGASPAISVSGKTVTWNATNPAANFDLAVGFEVFLEYQTTEL